MAGLPRATAGLCLALMAFGFVAYLLLWRQAPVIEGDSPQYLETAQDLADGRLDAVHDRSLGYPVLLAVTGSFTQPTRTLFVAQLALHFAAVWLLAAALQSSGVARPWIVGFTALMLLPPYVEPSGTVMTESLAEFTLAAGLAGLIAWMVRRNRIALLLASVAIAYAGLTRPVYQGLSAALALTVIFTTLLAQRRRLPVRNAMTASAVVLVTSALLVGGVSLQNARRFGFFGVAPTLGLHLTTKTWAFFERLPDEYGTAREILVKARDAELTKRGGTHSGSQAIWAARSDLTTAVGARSTPELSRYLVKMNIALIRRAPFEYLEDVARSAATYWFPPAGSLAGLGQPVLRWLWTLVHAVLFSVLCLQLAVIAAAGLRSANAILNATRPRVLLPIGSTALISYALAAAIVFYTMAVSCMVDIGEVRQRRPTDVLWIFMCVLGLHLWRSSPAPARLAPAQPS